MRIWWVLLVLISSLGCKREQPAAPAVTPPTVAAAEAFGKEFAKHLTPCDGAALDEKIDFDLVAMRAFAGRKITDGVMAGTRTSFNGSRLCPGFKGMDYVYLRTQTVEGTPRPLLRGVSDRGMSYLQLELDTRTGQIRVADVYVMATGEQTSQSMRNVMDALLSSKAAVASQKMKQIVADIADGKLAEARESIHSLPPALRATKSIRVAELQTYTEEPEYMAALDDFVAKFPGDPALLLHQVHRTLVLMQYAEALAALDKLDRALGGDPYLELMRALAHDEAGKPAEALAATRRATEREPTLEIAWWALAARQATAKDFTGALATFDAMRARFGAEFDDGEIRSNPIYAALAASAEYAAWSKGQ